MNKCLILLIIIVGLVYPMRAQELECTIQVNSDRITTSDREIFRDMENEFSQFLNDRKWTNDVYAPEERIKCTMIIGIDRMPSIGSFSATVQIQSVRPVYNTNLETRLIALTQNYADSDWEFDYTESQRLDFNENGFLDNLTSILAYYAYIIIGMDYDSFSKLGGTPYFERAFNIVNNAQQSGNTGWQQFVTPPRNRYWLIENLNSPQFRPLRESIYEYHRLGLDQFHDKPDDSRKIILEVLKKLQQVNEVRPNSFMITLFLYSKWNEIVNIYSEGDMQIRREAFNILSKIDPTRLDKYQSILSN